MKDRIKQYMDYKNISAGELASLLDVQRSNISHILNGRNKPGASFIEKFLLTFPDLNARWLLTGVGEMIETKRTLHKETAPETPEKPKSQEKEKTIPTQPVKQDEQRIQRVDQQVNRVVLLFGDGSFIDYNKKSND